jgi:hypothetical protein
MAVQVLLSLEQRIHFRVGYAALARLMSRTPTPNDLILVDDDRANRSFPCFARQPGFDECFSHEKLVV